MKSKFCFVALLFSLLLISVSCGNDESIKYGEGSDAIQVTKESEEVPNITENSAAGILTEVPTEAPSVEVVTTPDPVMLPTVEPEATTLPTEIPENTVESTEVPVLESIPEPIVTEEPIEKVPDYITPPNGCIQDYRKDYGYGLSEEGYSIVYCYQENKLVTADGTGFGFGYSDKGYPYIVCDRRWADDQGWLCIDVDGDGNLRTYTPDMSISPEDRWSAYTSFDIQWEESGISMVLLPTGEVKPESELNERELQEWGQFGATCEDMYQMELNIMYEFIENFHAGNLGVHGLDSVLGTVYVADVISLLEMMEMYDSRTLPTQEQIELAVYRYVRFIYYGCWEDYCLGYYEKTWDFEHPDFDPELYNRIAF